MDQHFSTVWHHMAKIICIVPNSTTLHDRILVLKAFTNFGFLNVVTVHEQKNGDIHVDLIESMSGEVEEKVNPVDASMLFPDKLKNMAKYRYSVPIHHQPPAVQLAKNSIRAPMLNLLKIVSKLQNASILLNILPGSRHLNAAWENRQMDLTLNTASVFDNMEPKLINYEKKGFCAMVPKPQKSSFFRLIIIMPFEGITWMLLGISTAASFAVWWMYRGRGAVDSHWKLLTEIFKMFIGQGANFSRNNHFMLMVMLQLICFSIFILSNAYESAITSCLIEPFHEHRLETVEDLFASDYEIAIDEGFAFTVRENDQFKVRF